MRYLAGLMAIIKILISLIVFLGTARLVYEIIYRIVDHISKRIHRRRLQRKNGIRPIRLPRIRTGGIWR